MHWLDRLLDRRGFINLLSAQLRQQRASSRRISTAQSHIRSKAEVKQFRNQTRHTHQRRGG